MGIKGCWTCRTRKLRCDSRRPACDKCTKARRVCQGYGIQLSWPRDGDNRRAVVSHNGQPLWTLPRKHIAAFVNVSSWDVFLSYTLEKRNDIATHFRTMTMPQLDSLPPFSLGTSDAHLLEFFNESRSRLLAPIVDNTLAEFILRVALSDQSPSSNLVLQSVLAIASLRLQGHSKGFHHKARAISILHDSIAKLDRESVLRNLTATMLLYQYELSYAVEPSDGWTMHLCGAKRLIKAASATDILQQPETAILIDWIYYHEVSSEFTLRHWRTPRDIPKLCEEGPLAKLAKGSASGDLVISQVTKSSTDALSLVSMACRRSSPYDKYGRGGITDDDMIQIKNLERQVYKVIGEEGPSYNAREEVLDRRHVLSLLYQIAALIYLDRVVLKVSDTSFRHRRLVREGMLLLGILGSCESAWPLFILACEASGDEQRLEVMEIFSKTSHEQTRRSNHAYMIQAMVTAVWNQNDLNIDNGVDYSSTLDAVISAASHMPLFA